MDPQLLKLFLDPPTFYSTFCTWEGKAYEFDAWQIEFMRSYSRFRVMEKSVQIGFSWITALEALHRAFFYLSDTSIFVSNGERDSKEKISFARQAYGGIPDHIARFVPIISDTREEIVLGTKDRPSRLVSRPATSGLRGIAGHVYLDELDFYDYGNDRAIFAAAMGRITRQDRRLTVGSSVFGEHSQLAEMMRKDAYPDFLKFRLPWWCRTDPQWRQTIATIKDNLPEDEFKQEYECQRGKNASATFSQDLIRRCWIDGMSLDLRNIDADARLLVGYDPGGDQNPAATTVLQERDGKWHMVHCTQTRKVTLADQEFELDEFLDTHPDAKLVMDPVGIGRSGFQSLVKKWGARRVVPFYANKKSKAELTENLKRVFEKGDLKILRIRQLNNEIQGTRLLPNGTVQTTGRSVRGSHFDMYWSLAMAASPISKKSGVLKRLHSLNLWGVNEDEDI